MSQPSGCPVQPGRCSHPAASGVPHLCQGTCPRNREVEVGGRKALTCLSLESKVPPIASESREKSSSVAEWRGEAKVRSCWPGFRGREEDAGCYHAAPAAPGAVQGWDTAAQWDQPPLWLSGTEVSTRGGAPGQCHAAWPGAGVCGSLPVPWRLWEGWGTVVVVSPWVPV